jgi:aquaporin Z
MNSLVSALVAEVVLTRMFRLIIMGTTDKRAPAGFAPIVGGALGGFVYRSAFEADDAGG